MEDNEPDDLYFGNPSRTFGSKPSPDSGVEESVYPARHASTLEEANSASGDWLNTSHDVSGNGNEILEEPLLPSEEPHQPSTYGWQGPGSASPDPDYDPEDDNPMEIIHVEDPPSVSESSDPPGYEEPHQPSGYGWRDPEPAIPDPDYDPDDDIPMEIIRVEDPPSISDHQRSYQSLHSISGMDSTEAVAGLCSRAYAFIDELFRSLGIERSDYVLPVGRLPVSITPESSSIKINLKNRTSSIVEKYVPPKFKADRNKGLPSMNVSEEGINRCFDTAAHHLGFWASKLLLVMNNERVGDEEIHPEDFSSAFELFQSEFLDFDEMVGFSLRRLRPLVAKDVISGLEMRQRAVRDLYWKLEIACALGKLKDQEGYLSHVSEEIGKVLRSVWSVFAAN